MRKFPVAALSCFSFHPFQKEICCTHFAFWKNLSNLHLYSRVRIIGHLFVPNLVQLHVFCP